MIQASAKSRSVSIREVSLRVLYLFETEGVFVRDTLDGMLRQGRFDDRDRSFATELVYGTLRWRGRLDWILDQVVQRGMASLTPWVRNILRMGVYQVMMMDQVPAAAATHESVELAKRYGHPGTVRLTNAVLRTVIRRRPFFQTSPRLPDPAACLSTAYSYPLWMVERWLARYGEKGTAALCEAGNRPPAVVVRSNRLKTTPADLADLLTAQGVTVHPGRYLHGYLTLRATGDIRRLPGYEEGLFQVQDESAGLPVRLLDPQPAETVVDLCSAPGGKAAYMAELMGDRGRIIAVDIVPERLRRLQAQCRRMALRSVFPVAMDGRMAALRRPADRVLIDAPCTGLGTVGRRPELRWRRQPEDLVAVQHTQRALLDQGATLVKPDGVLVYSTCTIEPEENEMAVTAFLERHPAFRIETPVDWPAALSDLMDADGMVRTLPSTHGIDGSFAVRLRKGN